MLRDLFDRPRGSSWIQVRYFTLCSVFWANILSATGPSNTDAETRKYGNTDTAVVHDSLHYSKQNWDYEGYQAIDITPLFVYYISSLLIVVVVTNSRSILHFIPNPCEILSFRA